MSNPYPPLAIVGIGCRLPGGVIDTDTYWDLLINHRSGITEVPANRWNWSRYYHPNNEISNRMVTKWGGFIKDHDQFDAEFFNISPREARHMDPQQRWLLETAWETLEDAGLPLSHLRGSRVGVFIGISTRDYTDIQRGDMTLLDVYTNSGNALSIAANRISYFFDFQGPSMVVDTACSSALVAVQLACQSIWTGQSTMALAGGVNALFNPNVSIGFSKASMLSPDGQCFAFDHRANGYVRSEGVALVALKPLEQALADGDRVYASIRAAVVNQDGHTSSLTVPDMTSQEAMMNEAYQNAQIDPSHVVYVEAHGTGTPVGDPIEAHALGHVLSANRLEGEVCLIGSVKTNIGHLEAVSGMAGLIKAALILHHGLIPSNLNFEKTNPNIPLAELGLQVVTENRPLPNANGRPPVVGVNSFGFGGTNAHVVLEQASPPEEQPGAVVPDKNRSIAELKANRPYLLAISVRNEAALQALVESYQTFLAGQVLPLADVACSTGTRREHHQHRLVVIGQDTTELRARLQDYLNGVTESAGLIIGQPAADVGDPVFVFTGQGVQWWGMGQQLLAREPIFRQTIEKIDALLQPLTGWSLMAEMSQDEQNSRIEQTDIAQPAIFALQVALTELWKSWGIQPAKVIGHSVGEVAAAYVAGIYHLADAVKIICHRSRLQSTTRGQGCMAAVGLSLTEAEQAIDGYEGKVAITALNSPQLVTLGGDIAPMKQVINELETAGRFVRWLPIDYAFHTHQMDPIQVELLAALADIQPRQNDTPFISTVTGRQVADPDMGAEYWWQNVRRPVQFAPALAGLIEAGANLFLELGPHPSLRSSLQAGLAEQNRPGYVFHSLRQHTAESLELLGNLAALHICGLDIDWAAVNQSSGRSVKLPPYPWQRRSFWVDTEIRRRHDLNPLAHPLLGIRIPAPKPTWQHQLDPRILDYLNDHRIWDNIVFPGAGYGEIGLAVAAALFPDEPYVVEDLQIKKALFLTEQTPTTIQVIFDEADKSFYIHSLTSAGEDWDLNACGRLQKLSLPTPEQVNIAAVRDKMELLSDKNGFYQLCLDIGYQYGPNFQQIQNVWYAPDQALAEVVTESAIIEQSSDYHFHPALLDACIQAVIGTGVRSENKPSKDLLSLPVFVRRIRLFSPIHLTKCWVKASILRRDSESILADIQIYDQNGYQVAEVLGFRFDRVGHKTSGKRETTNHLCQLRWEPKRLKSAPVRISAQFAATVNIVAEVERVRSSIYAEYNLDRYFQEFLPRFDKIIWQIIQNTLLDLGWQPQVDSAFSLTTLMHNLGIIESYRPLVRTLLAALEKASLLQALGQEEWQVLQGSVPAPVETALAKLAQDYPRNMTDVALIQAIAPQLAAVLRGRIDPLKLLFPEGDSELLRAFYRDGADQAATYQLIQTAVLKAIENLPPHRPLRVLELGAGTGALTSAILPVLPVDRTEYTFTDISRKFINEAKQQWADYPFVDYRLLDLTKEPLSQGFDNHSYDLILAANVIHATPNLKQTLLHVARHLADDGLFIFLELTTRILALDTIFGLFSEWWHYDDRDLRSEVALLHRTGWENLLRGSGYRAVSSFTSSPNPTEQGLSVFIAMAPETQLAAPEVNTSPSIQATCLLFSDQSGLGAALGEALTQTGIRPLIVKAGSTFKASDHNSYTIDPTSEADLKRLLAAAQENEAPLTTIIHAWGLDQPMAQHLSDQALEAAQTTGTLHALRLAHALADEDLVTPPRVFFLTRGVQAVIEGDRSEALTLAPLMGFIRVVNNEHATFAWRVVDLDPVQSEFEVEDLLHEITVADGELEIAYRNRRRYVNRLQQIKPDSLPLRRRNAVQTNGQVLPYRLQFDQPGQLIHLTLNETRCRPPASDEVEVQVRAGGLNFRDVMKALGLYPGNPIDLNWLGDDFAGVVVTVGERVTDLKPGDAVVGVAPYAFQAYVTVHHQTVFKKPDHMSFEEAATLPTVFLTANYALNHLARMRAGERILIHAGAGGVGLAAIQIAQDLGLEIFATAGTPQKRAFLRKQGVQHVFNSRSLDFADEIMAVTRGYGVDAVLNSLAGDFISKNFSILAPFGRYLEIGKVDIYNNSKIGLEPLRNNISVFVIDLAQFMEHRPNDVTALFEALRLKFENKDYHPLPQTVFPITKAVEAFRHMASSKHIGKNVLSFDLDEIPVGRNTGEGQRFRPDVTYLITGGASGLGLNVAKWLAGQGVRHLVLMSRSGPRDEAARLDIEQLRADGVQVVDARGDVAVKADVERVVQQIQAGPAPLAGIIHSVMALHDELVVNLDEEGFKHALNPKMLGAWNLHLATLDIPLADFICFSSMSGVIGAIKQANYSAGNTFLDVLAHYRRAIGLPALTIDWSPLSDTGVVSRHENLARYIDMFDVEMLTTNDALQILQCLLPLEGVQVGLARYNWSILTAYLPGLARSNMVSHLIERQTETGATETTTNQIMAAPPEERQALMEGLIKQTVAEILDADSDNIDSTTALANLGLDSLTAIELINSVNARFDMNLPFNNIFSGATIQEIATLMLEKLLTTDDLSDQGPAKQTTSSDDETWVSLLDQIDAQVDLPTEAQLDPGIYAEDTAQPPVTDPQAILLTGATGFLGAFLLAELLHQTRSDIYCLVRCTNFEAGMQRLQDNLVYYGLWDDKLRDRLVPVKGDLAQPHLGLSANQFQTLAQQVDVIYHNGARLDIIRPYQTLKASNVLGTEEILRLAGRTKIKPVHYVSTIAVFFAGGQSRDTVIRETDWPDPHELRGGYMQSKWVAEQLIRQAQQRGIPGSIYRPGIIVGHSQTGATNTQDLASRVLRGCYQLGVYPDQTISFNVVPVDYVGRAIVHLARQPATLGQIFHLTNPQPTQIADIIKWSGSLGADLQEVSYPEWRTFLMQQAKQRLDNDLLPLLPLFSSDRPEQVKQQVDCQHALRYLANSDIVCPAIDKDLIELYAAYLTDLDFFAVS